MSPVILLGIVAIALALGFMGGHAAGYMRAEAVARRAGYRRVGARK